MPKPRAKPKGRHKAKGKPKGKARRPNKVPYVWHNWHQGGG